MIHCVKCFFLGKKNTPTTYFPVSRALETFSTSVASGMILPESKLVLIKNIIIFQKFSNVGRLQFFLRKGSTDIGL